jgi:selenocysteine lyase/cysteine desulfurase
MPPDSDEAGSPNVVGAVALARAVRELEDIGLDVIADHEAELAAYALEQLKTVPGLTLYGSTNPAQARRRSGVIPFTLQDIPSQLVAAILGCEWGIGVRAGCFCAQPYVMQLLDFDRAMQHRVRYSVLHGRRDHAPGMVRISFGLYNTKAEIDTLIEALQAIARSDYGQYAVEKATGVYMPLDAREDFSKLSNKILGNRRA